MSPQSQRLPTSSIKTRFAYGFLQTLKRLNNHHEPTSSSSPRAINRRYRMIKLAADSSMASAVGYRRLWSREILRRIRCRARRHRFMVRRSSSRSRKSSKAFMTRRRSGEGERKSCKGLEIYDKTNELKRLVPGGTTMDLKSLFDETAHYIKCLTTQVQVMRNIAEFCSS